MKKWLVSLLVLTFLLAPPFPMMHKPVLLVKVMQLEHPANGTLEMNPRPLSLAPFHSYLYTA